MKFTLQQLKAAHEKVKSGADFPGYIKEIKALGLARYIYSVIDGSIIYYGNEHTVSAPAIYTPKSISLNASTDMLRGIIATHQQGKTDFITFCQQAAEAGVRQWVIDTNRMLCIYEDKDGNEMIAELIPDSGY